MRPRPVLAAAAAGLMTACVITACGSPQTADPGGTASTAPPQGSASLGALCQEIHASVDALIASDPASQAGFVEQIQRLSDAADYQTRRSLAALLDAGRALIRAGVGPDFYTARDGVHSAVVGVNAECVKLGSPILHR